MSKKTVKGISDSERCPFCMKTDFLDWGSFDYVEGQVRQEVSCAYCGSVWEDIYQPEGRSTTREPSEVYLIRQDLINSMRKAAEQGLKFDTLVEDAKAQLEEETANDHETEMISQLKKESCVSEKWGTSPVETWASAAEIARRVRAMLALEEYSKAMYGPKARIDRDVQPDDDTDTIFIDLVTDLWHLAEHLNISMEEVIQIARNRYKVEIKSDGTT